MLKVDFLWTQIINVENNNVNDKIIEYREEWERTP